MALATIKVSNLRLRAYIGFNPDEKTKLQDVIINLMLAYPASQACIDGDEVSEALDYKTITKRIINYVDQGHFLLLERLTADVLSLITSDERIVKAEVTIDKPHALRFADSVSVTLTHDADNHYLSKHGGRMTTASTQGNNHHA